MTVYAMFGTLLLLMVVHIHHAVAGMKTVTKDVGGRTIYIPAPAGFHPIGQLFPDITAFIAKSMTPPENRLLEVFVSERDLGQIMKGKTPELRRYMLVQVGRQMEYSNVSGEQFSHLQKYIKEQQGIFESRVKNRMNRLLGETSRELLEEHDIPFNLTVEEQVALGVFMEKSDLVGFASLIEFQVDADGEQTEYLMVCGTSFVRVKGKILYVYVYSNYDTLDDLEWARTISAAWTEDILISNHSTGRDYQNTGILGFNWNEVFKKGATGAIVGGILALIVGAFRGAKKWLATGRPRIRITALEPRSAGSKGQERCNDQTAGAAVSSAVPAPPLSIERSQLATWTTIASAELPYKEAKHLGTKWLRFWSYFSLPAGGVLGLLMSLSAPVLGIIMIPLSVLQLAVAYGLHRRRLWAWRWNWFLIAISFISMSIPVPPLGSRGGGEELLAVFAVRVILGSVIWMWPNFVYWKKRKVLFT